MSAISETDAKIFHEVGLQTIKVELQTVKNKDVKTIALKIIGLMKQIIDIMEQYNSESEDKGIFKECKLALELMLTGNNLPALKEYLKGHISYFVRVADKVELLEHED